MSIRPVKRIATSKPTMEGAGVKLHRAFGFGDTGDFDPFLLLDDFRNDRPEDYRAGFPWHPHRGIETITYVLSGTVEHADSLGNKGRLGSGDVQWMTAGSGIMHQEMPQGDPKGRMHGFQLWANLPASLKMTAPRYQRRGHGRGRRRRHPVSPRLRQAHRGTGRLVWPNRDEHQGGGAAGGGRAQQRHLHQAQVKVVRPGSPGRMDRAKRYPSRGMQRR